MRNTHVGLDSATVATAVSTRSEARSQSPPRGKLTLTSKDVSDGVFSRREHTEEPKDAALTARDEAIRNYIRLKREELRLEFELNAMGEKFPCSDLVDQDDLH